jgi:hypothetical protein
VQLTFGSEYEIGLHPHTGRRSVAKVSIDGNEVTANGLVLPGYQCVWLERPVAGSNRRFKFVGDDSREAIEAGKSHIDDAAKGVIRVEFYLEKWRPPVVEPFYQVRGTPFNTCDMHTTSMMCSTRSLSGDAGVTVEGSESSQRFDEVSIEWEETPAEVITVTLRGAVQRRQSGAVNYCSDCGAYLNPLKNYCPGCGRKAR